MARSGRIALAQVNTTVGDFAGNAARVRAAAEVARDAGAALAVFPELTVCGYPPRDLLDLPDFLERARQALEELARPAAWSKGIALVVGFPEAPAGAPPPGVYNAAALISEGRVAAVGRKSLLPTYDVFDETRYFLPAGASTTAAAPEGLGVPLGLSVCEDIWNDQRFWDRPRYARDPIADLVRAGAGLVVNVSASPYAMGKAPLRERMLSASARDHGAPIAYVNQVGGNDALLFDGGSMLLARDGAVLARAPLFEEVVLVCDLDGGAPLALGLDGRPLPPPPAPPADPQADEVLRALVMGVRDYVRKCGFRQAVVGLSGGIDSALTACVAAEALGAENVLGVAMPSRYSSGHSREDAAELARNLGVGFREIGIEPMHAAFLAALAADGAPPLCDLADQNVQARIRGQILMAISNDTGALVLTTGNKSEIAVGYCTLYGDMAGGLAAIGDVPKTLVYRVARAANARAGRTLVPERTFTKPPSAELKPGQLDQDSLPPYDVLDDILQAYVEERRPLEAIVARGHDEATVRRVLRMVVQSEYKRRQAAPVLKVSEKAFGEGRRFPIAQGYRY
ncbi:NAD+ synthase [Anaeromyxobacter dehalogenans]|uniref:Glutamine-dependent NAD(+) synthetase n=1 Tax=Anaeromyxobacter dehalogenans (strain 2CP-C) TaxID=290397 RepID=Q2IMM6_ANADE|nr:NAD+ synthase [Anaeromyxobacter dehalogenans]ABC80061.1 NH(3)-dependent NAD(+) synthetase [Anaeromyxobacter dehalogenans 2CP-C]